MGKNTNLHKAKNAKKDEFYTQLPVIEKELVYYKAHFKDKVVFCNCDDPYESNFFKYFAMNFNHLGLKKLIATCYTGSPIAGEELTPSLFESIENTYTPLRSQLRKPYLAIITKVYDKNGDGGEDLHDVKALFESGENKITELKGDGDFRSQECIDLLKQSDIVVTNPPFSLFREYVAQLIEFKKKFLIIGNVNAVTYKEVFPLIAMNKLWLGVSISSGDREFQVPDNYPLTASGTRIDEKGNKYIRVKGVRWYTNLDHKKRHEELILWKEYTPEEYPKYDNYDAIEVSKTAEIPKDYAGVMGVPITFLDKYNPEQFEILGSDYEIKQGKHPELIKPNWRGKTDRAYLNNKRMYGRLLIKTKLQA